MGAFSFLFRSSPSSAAASNQPALPSSSSSAYPSASSSYPPAPSGMADQDEYDDVALGRPSEHGAQPRQSFSAPPVAGGYNAEAAYPPLPSFSRPSPSSSFAPSAGGGAPPIAKTFARLRTLLDAQSPLLLDSLSPPPAYGSRDEALLSLQAAIAPYVLPPCVVESYLQHDGQDSLSLSASAGAGGRGGTGLFYGLWWLPLERVEEEWRFWRKLEAAGGLNGSGVGGDAFSASSAGAVALGSRAHPYVKDAEDDGDLPGMSAFPPGWVRARYSHPGWLPLLTDRCGNYIGVDLDPPPPSSTASSSSRPPSAAGHARTTSLAPKDAYGQPGQVIAFGREIDDKVVLFPGDGPAGWARFLAAFVEDVERGQFARLGERPAGAQGYASGGGAGSEDEGREGTGEEGAGWGEDGDGLGERGYFEEGVYGEEVVAPGETGGEREAMTWVLRAPYRRLYASLSLADQGGIVALLCERSRRKWRSLGVGTRAQPASNGIGSSAGSAGRRTPTPLSVVVPERRSSDTKVEVAGNEGGEGSADTARPEQEQQQNDAPPLISPPAVSPTSPAHPLAPTEQDAANANASNVELVLSPPSPTHAFSNPPLPSIVSPRTSHESMRSHASGSSHGSGYLQQPPRRSKAGADQQQRRQSRRPPPPPPAPIGLPTFSELDFSDTLGAQPSPGYANNGGGQKPIPTATWLLNDGEGTPRPGGGMMGRLSFGSAGGGSPNPGAGAGDSLLPTSRQNSFSGGLPTSPPMGTPDHSAISIGVSHSREGTAEEGEDVPLQVPDERSRSTTALVSPSFSSPPASPPNAGLGIGLESLSVVVEGGADGEMGAQMPPPGRTASPGDQPYRA
ncbi:hypothetical protein JCM10213_007344 [Rhodosporidiobolus nylandii]